MLKYRLRHLKKLKKRFISQTDNTLRYRKVNIEIEHKSTKIINLVGYAILLLVTLDYGVILVSSQLFNPVWAYNTAGNLVENVWSILLGLLLVFYRRDRDIIKPKESFILKVISWLTFGIAILYFALAPLLVTNGFRIHRSNKAKIVSQIDSSKTQIQQYSQQLDGVSEDRLDILLQKYQKSVPEIEINSTQEFKNTLITKVTEKQQQQQQQIQNQLNSKKKNLLKTTLKWLMGTIISGMCFIMIWRYTLWARVS